jgi:hypothetical protein
MTGIQAQEFTIARLHYSGFGDWYSDPSSLPNLLEYLKINTPLIVHDRDIHVKITDEDFFEYPYLYLTGHGGLNFTDEEVIQLREHLLRGAFLHADDNYGLERSFRHEMKRLFPEKDMVELQEGHPIFHSFFNFPNGLPKIQFHDGLRPQAWGLFEGERLMVLYTYESDLGDGWEDAEVHHISPDLRDEAFKMGANIVYYALTQ